MAHCATFANTRINTHSGPNVLMTFSTFGKRFNKGLK
jgi:hypothetical protein